MPAQSSGANLLVKSLAKAGVERLFTLSGNQIMPVFDACLDEGIELIHVRHEAAAVHMSDAWGRLTGRPGVALLTAGPGHANGLSAMYVALAAESPLVLLSGHAPRRQLGRGAFQEMGQAESAGHMAKASWTATDTAQLGNDLARAFRIALTGRPGPVHISLPVDLLEAPTELTASSLPAADDFHPTVSLLDTATAKTMLAALADAARPLILAGPALTRGLSSELLANLAEATGIPVIGMESPRGIGDPSLGAFADVLARSDLILLLGKQLDFTLRFADPSVIDASCRFLQIDPETRVLERTARVLDDTSRLVSAEIADPLPALERLMQAAVEIERKNNNWMDEVQTAIARRLPECETPPEPAADGAMHAAAVCRVIRQALDADDEAVFISDGGEFGQWAQAGITARHRVINGPSGSIGSAIPFALAARLAFPDSRVVATLGDGTFGFHGMEFDTAVRYRLPVVAVVGNDACWNAERQIQLRKFGEDRLVGCDLLPTRYDEVVAAMGGRGDHATTPDELKSALEQAFESQQPTCINVPLQRVAAPEMG